MPEVTDADLRDYFATHPEVDLTEVDLAGPDAADRLGLSGSRATVVLEKLRAWQRVRRIAPDDRTAQALLDAGLDSAHRIARMPEHRFVREHGHLFAHEPAARETHRRAASLKAALTHAHADLHALTSSPAFGGMRGNAVHPDLVAYVRSIPSYQDLFGGLAHIACPECASIFSPAAYFVDLMRIVDDYITDHNRGTIPDRFLLASRRPDLFEQELTCEATNNPIPTLRLVNEILARVISDDARIVTGTVVSATTTTVTLDGQASPHNGAYDGLFVVLNPDSGTGQRRVVISYDGASRTATLRDPWTTPPEAGTAYAVCTPADAALAVAHYPFNLPWNAPLARIRDRLAAVGSSLEAVYGTLAAPEVNGTVVAWTEDTVTLDEAASTKDGAYTGMILSISDGMGSGQARTITSYVGATRTASLDRPWVVPPDRRSGYRVTDPLPADREQLGLSLEQYAMLTTPASTPEALGPNYGYTSIDPNQLRPVSVFLDRTGLSREELEELLTQGLSSDERTAGLGSSFFINATGETPAVMSIAMDTADPNAPYEVIDGLTLRRLDRLNRFIRLCRAVGWDARTVQTVLTSVGATELDRRALSALATVKRLAGASGLGVAELCAFWSEVSTIGRGDGPVPLDLFDRIFNAPALLGGQDPYRSVKAIPFDPNRPLVWDPTGATGQNGVIRTRLRAALEVSDDDLTRLAGFVAALRGDAGPLELTLAVLSWLYRLAAGSRLVGLPVGDYLLLLDLLGYPVRSHRVVADLPPAPSLAETAALVRAVADFFATGLSVAQARYVVRGAVDAGFTPPYRPDDVAPFLADLSSGAEAIRLSPSNLSYATVTPERAQAVFDGLVDEAVATPIGIVSGGQRQWQDAALRFPLGPDAFVSTHIDAAESAEVLSALASASPPVLEPVPGTTGATLSPSFTADTDLSYLFPDRPGPEAANARNLVRAVLLATLRRIEVTAFANLFRLTPADLHSAAVDEDDARTAFAELTAQSQPLLEADPAAGQRRTITAYDGTTHTATVQPDWTVLPGRGSEYQIWQAVTTGSLAGATLTSVTLAPTASPHDDAYTGMTVTVSDSAGGSQSRLVTGYDATTHTATVSPAWAWVPVAGQTYLVEAPVTRGRARGASSSTVDLSAGASSTKDAYIGMTVEILPTALPSARIDARPDLGYLFKSAGSGQSRTITHYDGPTRTITVDHPWDVLPDATSMYEVLATGPTGGSQVVARGRARGGGSGFLYLAVDASGVSGAYDHMTVTLVDDPDASRKRSAIAQVLVSTVDNVAHTAEVVASVRQLQLTAAAQGVADFLSTTTDRLAAVAAAVGVGLDRHLAELLTPAGDGQVPPGLPPLFAALSRALVCFDGLGLSDQQIKAVAATPRAIGVMDPRELTLHDVTSLAAFAALDRALSTPDDSVAAYLARPDDPGPGGGRVAALASLTNWPADQIALLAARFWPAPAADGLDSVAGLARLRASFGLATGTGMDVASLLSLTSLASLPVTGPDGAVSASAWEIYEEMAELAAGTAAARGLGDDARLLEVRRDALLGYSIWLLGQHIPDITDANDVYNYLLIDVEVAGTDVTSPIVAGIASLQLYLQRCRLMMEPGVTDLTHIPDAWWQWMTTYRVWEANRRVFLYPENYLQPSLRRGASPEFTAMVSALQQSDVTPATASSALRDYVDGFATVANLVICGAYETPVSVTGTSEVRNAGTVQPVSATELRLDSAAASRLGNEYEGMTIVVGKGSTAQTRRIVAYNADDRAGDPTVTVDAPFDPPVPSGTDYAIMGPRVRATLVLLGRTRSEPHRYYHRRYDPDNGWTPWREVEVSIPSPYASPALALDRLAVTWVEQRSVDLTQMIGGTQVSQSATNATVKVAVLDQTGAWSTPQTLRDDLVIAFTISGNLDAYLKKTLPGAEVYFDPDFLLWRRVFPLHILGRNMVAPVIEVGDRLLLAYGPSFGYAFKPLPPPQKVATYPPAQRQFEQAAADAANTVNELVQGFPGHLPILQPAALDQAMGRPDDPFTCYDTVEPGAPLPYHPVLDRPGRTLSVAGAITKNVLVEMSWYDDYPGVSRPPNPTLGAGGAPSSGDSVAPLVLLSAASGAASAITTVKNRPGSFIYDNGDEAFLVRSSDPGIRYLSESIMVKGSTNTENGHPLLILRPQDFTGSVPAPALSELTFAFTRLSTRAATALPGRLAAGGVADLLSLDAQNTAELDFGRLAPSASVTAPKDGGLDFSGAYGFYFWETFFHAPFLIADALSAGQRFAEAKTWFEYIFNPMQPPSPGDEGEARFWRFLPLRTMDLPTLVEVLTNRAQITAYNDDPFDPDAIARLRISAYAKAIVMRYIGNLLAWGDFLFTQDTRESITEATNLYVMALDLLGPRPRTVAAQPRHRVMTYNSIKAEYNDRLVLFGSADDAHANDIRLAVGSAADDAYTGMHITIISMDGYRQTRYITAYDGETRVVHVDPDWALVPPGSVTFEIRANGVPQFLIRMENSDLANAIGRVGVGHLDVPFNDIDSYFCVPENDQLMSLWDTAEDRLYKIRHGLNIEGVARTLPFFSPPLNPADLVKSAAAGAAGTAPAAGIAVPVPYYRFETLLGRAKQLAAAAAQLGEQLLGALDRRDAEALSSLRVAQEQVLLNLATVLKEQAVTEADQVGASLAASLDGAQARHRWFSEQIAAGLSIGEQANLAAMALASAYHAIATDFRTSSGIAYALPQVGSPFAITYGGQQVGSSLDEDARLFESVATVANFAAQLSLTLAQYERRKQEWQLQAELAQHDMDQIRQQIQANQTRRAMAQQDVAIHRTTIAQQQAVADFLSRRFTNEELYQWMATRLSTLHFQTYALALDLARKAQRAYQYELDTDTTFIDFSYWDGSRRGLLAGEGLQLALNQMEKSYLDRNARRLEISKTISLLSTDPLALLTLIRTGECVFTLPERLFDDDFPGHYARKIESISVSIPAITGPYQNVHATLRQLASQIVVTPDVATVNYLLGAGDAELPGPETLRTNWWVNQQIAISNALGDSGISGSSAVDGRYLPFEGTGAVSTWRLSMPKATNRFDFEAISDVVITLRYTARDGGARFREAVIQLPAMAVTSGNLCLPLERTFSAQWYEFLHQTPQGRTQTLRFAVEHPVPPHLEQPVLIRVYLLLRAEGQVKLSGSPPYLQLQLGAVTDLPLANTNADGAATLEFNPPLPMDTVTGAASLTFLLDDTPAGLLVADGSRLDPEKLRGAVLVLMYDATPAW